MFLQQASYYLGYATLIFGILAPLSPTLLPFFGPDAGGILTPSTIPFALFGLMLVLWSTPPRNLVFAFLCKLALLHSLQVRFFGLNHFMDPVTTLPLVACWFLLDAFFPLLVLAPEGLEQPGRFLALYLVEVHIVCLLLVYTYRKSPASLFGRVEE